MLCQSNSLIVPALYRSYASIIFALHIALFFSACIMVRLPDPAASQGPSACTDKRLFLPIQAKCIVLVL
jgi:hypothetical protein